jgi:hypothetical protein
MLLGNNHTITARRANSLEKFIKRSVSQWVIDEPHYTVIREVKPHTGEPFPVTVMSQHCRYILSIFKAILNFLHIINLKMFFQMLFTNTQKFDGLKKIITKPMIKSLFYLKYFCLRLLRERSDQILPHNFPAVSQQIIYDKIFDVRENVQHPERE